MGISNNGRMSASKWMAAFTMAAVSLGFAQVSLAQSYPSKPIQFVVPYAAGGPLDNVARLLAEKVRPELGQPVVVENRPGAGGNIGAGQVAKAAPDGYTLVMGAVAINAINPWLYPDIPFDPVKSFAPVTLAASVPNVLIVNADFAKTHGIESVKDLAEYARTHEGELNFASGGNGSAGHLAGELFNVRQQLKTVHVPYAGAAPAKVALLAGQVHFMFDNLASATTLIKDNQVKALAVTTAERSSIYPELPSMQEAGVDDFDLGTWFGVFATGGTPDDVVQTLHSAYAKALSDPDIRKVLLTMGSDSEPNTPAQFADMVKSELAKYKEIVEVSGAKLF